MGAHAPQWARMLLNGHACSSMGAHARSLRADQTARGSHRLRNEATNAPSSIGAHRALESQRRRRAAARRSSPRSPPAGRSQTLAPVSSPADALLAASRPPSGQCSRGYRTRISAHHPARPARTSCSIELEARGNVSGPTSANRRHLARLSARLRARRALPCVTDPVSSSVSVGGRFKRRQDVT